MYRYEMTTARANKIAEMAAAGWRLVAVDGAVAYWEVKVS